MKNQPQLNRRLLSFIGFLILFTNQSSTAQEGWGALWRSSPKAHYHLDGVSWSRLSTKNSELERTGYRLIDVETHLGENERKYHAIWKKDYSPSRLLVKIASYKNFLQKKKDLQNQYTLIDIETYVDEGEQYFMGIWQKSTEKHILSRTSSWEALQEKCAELKNRELSITDVEMYNNGSDIKYLAIFRTNSSTKNKVFQYTKYDDLKAKRKELTENGWRPLDFERERLNGKKYYLCIFEKASGGWSMWSNLAFDKFLSKRKEKGAKSVQLIDIEVHQTSYLVQGLTGVYNDKIKSMPDLCQSDKGFPSTAGKGDFCGPTAASNGLFWLAKNGYPNLNPYENNKSGQIDLVMDLSTDQYMQTESKNGTGAANILRGLDLYITNNGYSSPSLEMAGWRCTGSGFSSSRVSKTPDLDWIKKGLRAKSGVLLNFGWYTYNASSNAYSRVGGHWVTAVGYATNEQGDDYLIVHDPAGRTGYNKTQQYVKLTKINSGYMGTKKCGAPSSLAGYYRGTGTFVVKNIADQAILDAVVIFKMD